ncbi:hypothetical protein [Flavobacterium sp. 1355]|uniref:hypothetical protein n=1 Tax=Flavobacterium sp. 1355 TaxID=2806571 RepID=UPI001AE0EFC4|nr:hypothetical protein [Flavobacterium sp. 1355]MBP1224878.1 membrane-anchored protein YejM (alkaline phosphatase superfamily) [Flavobacterium sp. 1355]
MLKKILILSILVLTACGGNETNNENPQNQVPKALQDDGITLKIGRYRSNDGLSEELYQELVTQNAELKKLETELENFNTADTLNIYSHYNGKSEDYYSSATMHANSIKDSILKNKMIALLEKSNEKYNQKTTEVNELIKTINKNQRDIRDYHNALKIILTIPIIEKYQIENLPKKSPFEKLIDNQKILLDKIKKNTPNIQ